MPTTDQSNSTLVSESFGVLHFKNGLVWYTTVLGLAIAAKASGNFT
jgi:hypothetical protein